MTTLSYTVGVDVDSHDYNAMLVSTGRSVQWENLDHGRHQLIRLSVGRISTTGVIS
jgi:hypothetical protein